MDRRSFVTCAVAGAFGGAAGGVAWQRRPEESFGPQPPISEIIPVVGDGKWIWTEPPNDKGYLEPRQYELSIGIKLQAEAAASDVKAATPVPVELPEQQ